MQKVKFILNGHPLEAEPEQSVLQAALNNGVYIPHLCHHPDLPDIGACNLCIIKIDGKPGIFNSCTTVVEEGMTVTSKADDLEKIRQTAMELILANHIDDCADCPKYLKCEFQALIQYMGSGTSRMRPVFRSKPVETNNPLFIRDMSRCVSCGRCVRMCEQIRGVGALSYGKDEGGKNCIIPNVENSLIDSGCRFCGACVEVCPTGALRDKEGAFKEAFAKGKSLIPCREECPAHVDIPAYVRACKEGDWENALAIIREQVPFPHSLGNICVHVCESKCRRKQLDKEIPIRQLKQLAAEKGGNLWRNRLHIEKKSGKKVAIIGGGPAGLTAAWFLALKGHSVDVYEKEEEAGGMLRYGIPEYRLDSNIVKSEIEEIKNIGVNIMTNQTLKSKDLNGYQAVLWAIGADVGMRLPLEGNNAKGTLTNIDFLKSVRKGESVQLTEPVLVLGGGNVAFDCARTAVRLGAKVVKVACLESRDKMTADEEEIEEGEKEGIEIFNSYTFHRILTENDNVAGVECEQVKSFSFDHNNKLVLELIPDTRSVIQCGTVIFATGQKSDVPDFIDIDLNPRGNIIADQNGKTSKDGIFAAGDVITGTASVIKAIASGKNAAQAIDLYLGGDGIVVQSLSKRQKADSWIGTDESFWSELDSSCGNVACTINGAAHCLQCDLRAEITKSKFQSEYR